MNKKLLSIGITDGGLPCCAVDSADIFELHCEDSYKESWQKVPQLWEGLQIGKNHITVNELVNTSEFCKDADWLRIFWSGHGCLPEVNGKKKYALYMGNNLVLLFDMFLEEFVYPIWEAKPKKIDIILDTWFLGKAKKKFERKKRFAIVENKFPLQEKFIELRKPQIAKLKNNVGIKQMPKEIRIISAATGKQISYGAMDCEPPSGFVADTHGNSLFTWALRSSIYNAYGWAVGYNKRNWNYILKLAQKRSDNELKSLGLKGWLESYPKTIFPKINVKAGVKASKKVL